MVRRPPDSRLLTNLLSHEKDYHKQLLTLLDSSHASLSSFAAYAAASSYQTSQVILAVTNSLAGADEALLRYTSSVDDWREHLKRLKDLEDEMGTVMRDREILVTRVLKASKSQKSNREPHPLNQPYTSSSSLSLKSEFSGTLTTSSKLAAAQAELQACEAHLAEKERELEALRLATIREGLSLRCKALVECGWVWGEKGKEAMRVIESLGSETRRVEAASPQPSSQVEEDKQKKSMPDMARPSSELSSLSPSQSASQVNTAPSAPIALIDSSTHIYSDANYIDFGVYSINSHSHSHQHLDVPPPHAISDVTVPTAASQSTVSGHPEPPPKPVTPTKPKRFSRQRQLGDGDLNRMHILSRRITEEDLQAEVSSDDETEPRGVTVVENPRFSTAPASAPTTPVHRRFSFKPHAASPNHSPSFPTSSSEYALNSKQERRVSSGGTGFFGTLKSLFKNREVHTLSDTESPTRKLFGSRKSESRHAWETRTDRNLRAIGRDSDDEMGHGRRGIRAASMDDGPQTRSVSTPIPSLSLRKRTTSESKAAPSAIGPSSVTTRRLRKDRVTERSFSGPPTFASEMESRAKRAEEWVDGQGEHEARHNDTQQETIATAPKRRTSKGKVKGRTAAAARQAPGTAPVVGPPPAGPISRNSSHSSAGGAKVKSGQRQPVVETVITQQPSSRPSSIVSQPAGAAGATSLMSIVEDVTRGNREGWANAERIKSVGGSTVPVSSVFLQVPKAPPPLGRTALSLAVISDTIGEEASLGVPKAPGSVFDAAPIAKSGLTSPRPVVGTAVGRSATVTSPRPSKSPLRSALRQPSRTPSPGSSALKGNEPAPPIPTIVQFPKVRAPSPIVVMDGEIRIKGRGAGHPSDSDERDGNVSTSSYETGHEVLTAEDTDFETEKAGAKHASSSTIHVPSVVSTVGPTQRSGEQAAVQEGGQQQPQRRKSVRVSLKPTFSPTPPAFEQTDEEEEEDMRAYSKQLESSTNTAPVISISPRDISAETGEPAAPRRRVVLDESRVPDLWQDSDDENEEYENAKKRLRKAGAVGKSGSNGW